MFKLMNQVIAKHLSLADIAPLNLYICLTVALYAVSEVTNGDILCFA
jgi:hypothetical protein